MSKATSVDRAVSSIFVLGSISSRHSEDRSRIQEPVDLASLTPEELGGIEYRALRVLLKVTIGTYGLHFGMLADTYGYRVLRWPSYVWCSLFASLDPSCQFKVQGLSCRAGSR
jgi:hypothetical protein